MTEDEKQQTLEEFRRVVNMTPKELEEWLETEESRSAGWSRDGGESVGHGSGRRIVAVKHKKKAEYTDDDYAHMRKVIGYCRRHLAQRPSGDVTDTRWRHSLMNWGHDPLKD